MAASEFNESPTPAAGRFRRAACALASAAAAVLIAIGLPIASALPGSPVAQSAYAADGGTLVIEQPAWYRGFNDIGNHWVVKEGWFDYVYDNGLMTGYNATTFAPDDVITRGQVATVLFRYSHPGDKTTVDKSRYANDTTGFRDAVSGAYYTAAINWAKTAGIFTGDTGKNTVRPNDAITRQELATVLYRYALSLGKDGAGATASSYKSAPDASTVAKWAREGMGWCYAHGVLTGDAKTKKLNPTGNATRAAMAKMVTVVIRDL